jgi:ABC-type bacteriocin/lantibiotic exporter with double-glycine peptidase domain
MSMGEFIAFNTAFGLFLAAMQALGDASVRLLEMIPLYERLQPLLRSAPESDPSRVAPAALLGGIELSKVSFRYGEDGPWILRDVSLQIRPGEFVAFVGDSGSGKSTLLRLLLGFERCTHGTIYYDGQDINSLDLRLLRRQMGVVLQVSRVMPTDIYRNIVGVSTRTVEDAWDAAEMAGLADDVRAMPMGLHTYVAEGGSTLSGGQRQRLLIARAIVNRPRLLFLDEATSALDNRTQAVVSESLERLDATRIVIAHRLSTIVNADRICVLDNARIVEEGTYASLMERDGLFARLARRQMA